MEKVVDLKNIGEKLGGKLFIPKGKGPFPAVVFFHGSSGIGETHFETAKMLSENGIIGLAFNYRGVGLSLGKFEEQTIMDGVIDGITAVTYLLFQVDEVDKNRIGFVGSSFGGFVASVLSGLSGKSGYKKQDAKSLVLIAPAAYSWDSEMEQRDSVRAADNSLEDGRAYMMISKFKGDLQIQICEEDEVVPREIVEKYYRAAKNTNRKELVVLKGAKHRYSVQPVQKKMSQEKIIEWFKKTL